MNSYAPRYYARPVPSRYGYAPSGYGYAPGLGGYGFPPLAALLPLAAKAIGAIVPVAAKAASAILPIAGKAASAIMPMAGKAVSALTPMANGLLPQVLTSLPGLIPMPGGGGLPGLPRPPLPPGAVAPAMPVPMPGAPSVILPVTSAINQTIVQRRRRRRPRQRSLVRVLRDRNTGEVKAVRPIVEVPAPVAAPIATSTSGGMAGFHGYSLGYPFAGLHAYGHCGGPHGLAQPYHY